MISKNEINSVIGKYESRKISIGTLGSHSALNIFKGAKEEGFSTVCVCKKESEIVYKRFPLADQVILVEDFSELLDDEVQQKLREANAILVPHGSFNAYVGTEKMTDKLRVPLFGNRELLNWETDREKQREWLRRAGLTLPRIFHDADDIEGLVIAKFSGAMGGKGYFLADSKESFQNKAKDMIKRGHLLKKDLQNIHFQEYIIGVNVYPLYFHSPLNKEVELLGMDRRYESTVDSIGKIPASEQLQVNVNPTYTVVGNFPIVARESLLPELLRMGENLNLTSRKIAPPGIIGPFCLETVITDDLKIYTFEVSARIVAGSNVGIGSSPYAYLKYGQGMYMGRRIALEIKNAIANSELEKVVY
uniref:5-formaminoimidazole-4-carboxamide-1-(beta)-D-ribofuranosyl 5'-monophosphate synthetase n=1 Tax=uncultured miscellaneous Crenarchaeota group TaxID=1368239 RepID=W8RW51_9ARCH|nr:5-formaminoimidazole-4-carboxamide-1-(beta)-D-ribofuranosyl 5'-monophosphate synthetase [uncultured miscellaneous Crenarchaeota group]